MGEKERCGIMTDRKDGLGSWNRLAVRLAGRLGRIRYCGRGLWTLDKARNLMSYESRILEENSFRTGLP